jgi:hypothetical protein
MIYKLRELSESEIENLSWSQKDLMRLMQQGVDIDRKVEQRILSHFWLRLEELRSDIRFLTVPKLANGDFEATPEMKAEVLQRDSRTCQYCSVLCDKPVVDHVIPKSVGEIAQPFNLVVACRKCNGSKSKSVWVPKNIDQITESKPEWKELIYKMADKSEQNNELRNCRIWAKTQRKLNRLAQLKGVKQVQMLDEVTNKLLDELAKENPAYAAEIKNLLEQNS